MSYYQEINRANKYIDSKIQQVVFAKGEELNINELILDVTSSFNVGDKMVRKRVELILKVRSDLRLLDDKIFAVE